MDSNFSQIASFSKRWDDSIKPSTSSPISSQLCSFRKLLHFSDLIALFEDKNCYRHTITFTVFLCVTNLLVLLFGILGNVLALYVVIFSLKLKTASHLFILNLAVADLLVIISCIPATLAANAFTPWIFSETTCKVVAYSQRLSVFCSVYSLVAISFDRCRAMQTAKSTTSNLTKHQACKIVLLIWILGFGITFPWAFSKQPTDVLESNEFAPAFCGEIWKTATNEAVYFLLVQVLARFAVPFVLITFCSVFIWQQIPTSVSPSLLLIPSCIDFRNTKRLRNLRVVKFFIGLNIAFCLFWLPLFLITAKLNFETMQPDGNLSKLEHHLASYLIPIAQLLGSCNNCINPVIYVCLSKKFREPLITIFGYITCSPWWPKRRITRKVTQKPHVPTDV